MSEPESEAEAEDRELDPVPDPQLTKEYQLTLLPQLKLPSSCDEYRLLNEELNPKILAVVSSPIREKYQVARESTNTFLMRGAFTRWRSSKLAQGRSRHIRGS
jgi:hypothetical protein